MLSNLPYDLIDEILSRVPTKSLIRLRSTCKRWNSLFDDHGFSKKHFDNAMKQNMFIYSLI
ncbi:putative F-box domain-containing protein [Arabidopsis thaliana]